MESTRTRLTKLMIVWIAVTAAILSTTACGNKNSGSSAKPAPPVEVKKAPPQGPSSEIDRTSGRSSQEQVGQVGQTSTGKVPATVPVTNGPEENAPEKTMGSVIHYDPSGMAPEQIFLASGRQGMAFTGEKSDVRDLDGTTLVYSGSGQDALAEELSKRVSSDKKLASSISNADFDIDWNTRSAKVSFILEKSPKKGSKRLQINTSGRLSNDLRFSAGSLKKSPNIAIDAVCMDLNGGCRTVHIKVQHADGDKVRVAHIIARKTGATLFIQGNGFGMAKNAEYDRFLDILLNTVRHPNSINSVTNLQLTTTEVIGGQSTFNIAMRMTLADPNQREGRDQYIIWSGPLVKPATTDRMNLIINQVPAIVPGGRPFAEGELISDSIRETRLVRNDGRGNLQLEVTVRKATAVASEETVLLTIGRIHKPVRPQVLR